MTDLTQAVTLELPYERPPDALTGNTRTHWRRRTAQTRTVRTDVLRLAQAAGLHQLGPVQHVEVELEWAPGDHRRRDADNLWPLLKACCDALARGPRRDWVGLEVVPDDTPQHMTKHAPRITAPPARGMWLHVRLDFGPEIASPAAGTQTLAPRPDRAALGQLAARTAASAPTAHRRTELRP